MKRIQGYNGDMEYEVGVSWTDRSLTTVHVRRCRITAKLVSGELERFDRSTGGDRTGLNPALKPRTLLRYRFDGHDWTVVQSRRGHDKADA